MEVSLGFFIALIFVLFPGLAFRKLYFYGEFSKEFNEGRNVIRILVNSVIPGLIIFFITVILVNNFFYIVNVEQIINTYKNLNNPFFKFIGSSNKQIISNFNNLLYSKIIPFIWFEYLLAIILGSLLGRLIRFSKLDIRFKILRFKNYWFYMFHGQYAYFKKVKYLKQPNKKFLFTNADILIESNSRNSLYSGLVIDYELNENDCNQLSKVVLKNAERYSISNGLNTRIEIPGTLLVVDCSNMININLTYIYEEAENFLDTKWPNIIDIFISLLFIFLVPFFIIKSQNIDFYYYNYYFNQIWYKKIFIYFAVIQSITLLNTNIKIENVYRKQTIAQFFIKLFITLFIYILVWIL